VNCESAGGRRSWENKKDKRIKIKKNTLALKNLVTLMSSATEVYNPDVNRGISLNETSRLSGIVELIPIAKRFGAEADNMFKM